MDSTPAAAVELASPLGRRLISATVMGSAVAMVTATVANVALPTLAADLGAQASAQKWVINGYLLSLASLILVGGALGDRYGRVRTYRFGLACFALTSVLCAMAPSIDGLIAARVAQGAAAALVTPGSLAIIEATLREEDRDRGVGLWSGLGGIAGAVGPLVGGALVDLSWRWAFVVNVPLALAAFVLARPVPESLDEASRDEPLDVAGAALAVVLLASASFALIEGPEGGWATAELAAVALVALSAAVLWRVERGRRGAVVPLDLLAIRPVAVANAVTLTVYGGMGALFFLLALQLQVTVGWSALAAGAALLPVTLILLVLSARAAVLAGRIGPRLPLTVGPLVMAAGMLLLRRVGPGASFAGEVLPGVVVFGLGLVGVVAPVTATALGSAPTTRAGAASALNNATARTGSLLAVAAIPTLVGLNGTALADPARLDRGFDAALLLAAACVALGGLIAFLGLGPATRFRSAPAPAPAPQCPVDGPVPHPRARA